ncbi:hypothetical protein B5X24_HaOG200734 [Helicoverpa armigera]|uniref:Gustatory receptor n=1 Tax=Helicoverpa armigera TaxID=29058 RepID=A0A2W1BTX4_HELAM|nr:hypothetical protein B5X24_HaOG200734 [Helicoverpa armigera]
MHNIQILKAVKNNNNIVDKDIQSMLLPLNLMHYIMCCPRYHIKNNLIIPNGLISHCVSIIGTIVFIALLCYRTYVLSSEYTAMFDVLVYYYSYYDIVYYTFGLTMGCTLSIIQTKKNVEFVLIFQKVHRFLNDETSFKNLIVFNWIFFVAAIVCHFFIVSGFFSLLTYYSKFVWTAYLLVFLDFYIINVIRAIKLIEDKARLWSLNLLNKNIENMDVQNYCKRMFESYFNILKCYDIIKVCFQQFVSMIITWLYDNLIVAEL